MSLQAFKLENEIMKKIPIILLLFISTFGLGQTTTENNFKIINELTIIDSLSFETITEGLTKSDGYGGYKFNFDSNKTFQKISFDCLSRVKVDSGTWELQPHLLILKSNKDTLTFNVVKFDKYYFFILPSEEQNFIKDIVIKRKHYKASYPSLENNKRYNLDYIVGFELSKKYYVKFLE